jgi:GrpB-like predicted nucleotidyltransferase (UPF0157 family)
VIEIVPSTPLWVEDVDAIAVEIRAALRELALRIDHIGSTSVPGLASKDRIDVQVTVRSLDDSYRIIEALTELGYLYPGEIWQDHLPPGWEGPEDEWRKLFFKAPPEARPANVHVRADGAPNQRYALLFRDYLRLHPAMAAGYAAFKEGLAAYLGADVRTYAELKDPVCDIIMAAAEDWAAAACWEPGASDK